MPHFRVIDCETDNLAYDCTKIHVLSWTDDGEEYHSTQSPEIMRDVLTLNDTMFVCHNAVRFDMVVFNRLLGLNLTYKNFVDTLELSWYLYPERNKHGLESWGEDLGVPKPVVKDWKNLTYEDYKFRCESDCKINWLLWQKMQKRLEEIYASDT